MCTRYATLIILVGWLATPTHLQAIANLSAVGFQFSAIDQQALLLFELVRTSRIACTQTCYATAPCRIFDYDDQSHRCRLFEGNLASAGSVAASASSYSRVGSIRLSAQQFTNRGRPCSFCQGSKFLTCTNSTCQCLPRTYFDGAICQSQGVLGAACASNSECRADLNYTCLPRGQCGPVSMQSAVTVGGYANGTSGSALNALNLPSGLSIDQNGSIYVADYTNSRIVKLQEGSLTGSVVAGTGVSGTGNSQLKGPGGVYVDASLNVYIADSDNSRVMLWPKNASSGIRVAGTGTSGSTLSTFDGVADVTVDSLGNMYISDPNNHRVVKWAPNATSGSLVAGTGVAGSTSQQLNKPYGFYLDEVNGYLYIADRLNHRIQLYQLNNTLNGTTVAGGNGAGTASNQFNNPISVYVSKKTGAIYVADSLNSRIQRWTPGATSGVTIAGVAGVTGTTTALLNNPMDIILSRNETYLYVSDRNNHRIQRFLLA